MKVKTITVMAEKEFEKKVNEFLANTSIEVIDIKYTMPLLFHSACIIYKELK